VEAAIDQTSPKDTIQLGQTGALLAHVLRLVPREDKFRYGMTYLDGLKQSIPNITPEIAKSSRQEARREVSKDGSIYEELAPSDWLTYRIAPWAFDVGQGTGFTSIGEAYLNFGVTGVVGFFVLLGFLLGRLDQVDLLSHPNWLLFSSALLWHLMRTVRDDFTTFTKPAIFTLIFLVAWRLVMRTVPIRTT
jgi:oligosaccharide repeat unit polymerase